jgi:hypothetical protein
LRFSFCCSPLFLYQVFLSYFCWHKVLWFALIRSCSFVFWFLHRNLCCCWTSWFNLYFLRWSYFNQSLSWNEISLLFVSIFFWLFVSWAYSCFLSHFNAVPLSTKLQQFLMLTPFVSLTPSSSPAVLCTRVSFR